MVKKLFLTGLVISFRVFCLLKPCLHGKISLIRLVLQDRSYHVNSANTRSYMIFCLIRQVLANRTCSIRQN